MNIKPILAVALSLVTAGTHVGLTDLVSKEVLKQIAEETSGEELVENYLAALESIDVIRRKGSHDHGLGR